MAKIEEASKRLVLKQRNAKLKTLNEFMRSVVASILESEDKYAAADKLNTSARTYLKTRKIAIPAEIDPVTVKFRAIHHGQPLPSTPGIVVKRKPTLRCNPFNWRYVGWYRDGNRVVHVWENECGDMWQCGGHRYS